MTNKPSALGQSAIRSTLSCVPGDLKVEALQYIWKRTRKYFARRRHDNQHERKELRVEL